jgi:hypothetical protein
VERVEMEVNCGLRVVFDFSAGCASECSERCPQDNDDGWGFARHPPLGARSGFFARDRRICSILRKQVVVLRRLMGTSSREGTPF